jgi:uncharacterized protein (DUF305 family)
VAPPDPASAAPAPAAPPDRAFLVGMVPHHQAAVDMAQVELDHGVDPRVRVLARSIVTDQQHEIGQMVRTAQEHYGFTPSTTRPGPMGELMGQPITMDMSMMGPMLAPDPRVDHAFLTMMIPHHAAGVVMADEEITSGTDPGLKTLSSAIITEQSREIGQMQAMLTAGT